MLYLGIDQHARQFTISLRAENGDVIQARQGSTKPEKVNAFFEKLTRERLQTDEEFVAVLEVCGFNDWLISMLRNYRCKKVILIQPEERKNHKTDRRDASSLSEVLWVNRDRLLHGKPVRGLRRVDIASSNNRDDRRLTSLRRDASRSRTRTIKHILRRHNLQWEMPTKTFPTQIAIAWLKTLALPEVDRLEIDPLLADLKNIEARLADLDEVIAKRSVNNDDIILLSTIPGVGLFTAVSLACRIGQVERFPRSHSLANYFSLTPGCRNSGENNKRLGSITKAFSSLTRWLLAQAVTHALRKDAQLREWYKRIKRRRGANIARVATMRKLTTIIWHMLTQRKTYAECRARAAP